MTPSDAGPAIEVSHLDVALGAAPVLRDVSLTVERGEMIGLLGANGSGKSTLLRTIAGIIPARSGVVRLFGRPVSERGVHDRLGYVPQFAAETGSIPATARETVATGLLGARRWRSSARDPRVRALLADVGLSDLADRPVTQMSGGQRQRVMIARALVRRPELLVLDEPFSGVDTATQATLSTLLARLSQRGTTVLVVLHELGPLTAHLTRTVVLDHGRVVHDGHPDERPLIDPGHDHAIGHGAGHGAGHGSGLDRCLGQEIVP
ncbi:metal ABC transporter ATP-binding protein [Brachybacterium huguangmaarense]